MSAYRCQCRLVAAQMSQCARKPIQLPTLLTQHRHLHITPTLHCSSHDRAASTHTNPPVSSQGSSKSDSTPNKGFSALRNLKKRGQSTAAASPNATGRIVLGQSIDQPIRTRFAPSPTGYVHLGSLRTALFNNVAARASKNGAFILRVEDTDQNRVVHDAEERLLEDLAWAGLKWDEGPDCGGPHGPYRQSERLSIYREHVNELINKGNAYRCFCTPEQLESQKKKLHEAGQPTVYPGTCRSVDDAESERRAADGEPHVVRFRSDKFGRPKTRDAIYGPFQKKDGEEDFVLIKSDGYPTYHFANVVDDHLMQITHVIRGEEWLISTPKHVALYEAFGWKVPTFAHLGLLVNDDGTKLSKRNASASISHYKNGDVFPMSLLAWLANLGSSFSAGTKPPRTIQEASDALTFKFTRGGIKLNYPKLAHYNSKYRDILLKQPHAALSVTETQVLDHHLIQPTLAAIHLATKEGTSAWPGQAPLVLIPQLAGDQAVASSYIHSVLYNRDGGFQDAQTLISQHPYLFWRVPNAVYHNSLKSHHATLDSRIIDAIEEVVSNQEYWVDGATVTPVSALRERLEPKGIESTTIHNVLRLVGAGGIDVVSQSSGRMIMLLGRDEWCRRLNAVQKILAQLK